MSDYTKSKNSKFERSLIENTQGDRIDSQNLQEKKGSLFDVYKFVDKKYMIILFVGILNAIWAGLIVPVKFFIFRDVMGTIKYGTSNSELPDRLRDRTYWLIAHAFGIAITWFIFVLWFSIVGLKVSYELKWRYMKAVLTKDTKWYEETDVKALPYLVNLNLREVQNATGRSAGFILFCISTGVCGLVVCFVSGILLAAWMLVIAPFCILWFAIQLKLNQKKFVEEENAYLVWGSNAEQALSAIKVVKAFNQVPYEYKVYERHAEENDRHRFKHSIYNGIGWSLVESVLTIPGWYNMLISGFFITGGVTNWIVDRTYNNGDQVCAIWAIQTATYFLGLSLMNFQNFNRGLVWAGSIFRTIDHVSEISLDNPENVKIDHIESNIIFDNVTFRYKDRHQNALDRVSLEFAKGKVTALVGASGSGKTTIAKLVERFYDPQSGSIFVNGIDLKNINLRDYRRRIGYVGQEPCLFNESIRNNLLNSNPSANEDDIIEWLKTSMAYDFVTKLPEGINSDVGALGSKLSGGQKQRIAIARALIRKPDLLILDEATSALDNRNEKYVQKAIENIRKVSNISTIVIAHRLTTVKDADLIVVLDNGRIVERGTHNELINMKGRYNSLYNSQDVSFKVGSNKDKSSIDWDIDENDESDSKTLLSEEDIQSNHIPTNEEAKTESWYSILKWIISYNRPYSFILIAIIGATLWAGGITLFQLPCAYMCIYFTKSDKSDIRTDMAKQISIAVGIGISIWIVQGIWRFCLHYISSGVTKTIRNEAYHSILSKTVSYFDSSSNSVGNLIEVLASQTKDLNGVSIEHFVLIYQGTAVMILCWIVSMFYCWNLGLIVVGLVPLLAVSNYILSQSLISKHDPKNSNYANTEQTVISDWIANYSTIASLAQEDAIIERYFIDKKSKQNKEYDIFSIIKISVLFALSQFILTMFYVPIYYIYASNVENGKNIIHSAIPQVLGMLAGIYFTSSLMNAPDFAKGKKSANSIFNIVKGESEGMQDSQIADGNIELTKQSASGDIEFRNVWFRYPTSSRDWILKDFCIKIKAGTSVGLVGESGSGKSTIAQLLLRFYDPQKGKILIDGVPITQFTISSLRSAFGFVQQEPQIFDRSILDNICYGKPHANVDEIRQAAIISNWKEFIDSISDQQESFGSIDSITDTRYYQLQDGYKLVCGPKGSKLSGGQKQRIAIARAVIRNPAILLFDEATSALDETSQAAVQNSINNVMQTTTSIVIAHRLSSLARCDKICVIWEGTMVEEGNFDKLMKTQSYLSEISSQNI